MLEQGTVTRVADGRADVWITPSEKCEECGACAEGAGGMRLMQGALDDIGVNVGDAVSVETPPQARRRAQLLVFVVPVVMLAAGYLAGYLLAGYLGLDRDALGAVCALAAAAAAFLSLRRASATGRGERDGSPRVHAIIARGRAADSTGFEGSWQPPERREDDTRE